VFSTGMREPDTKKHPGRSRVQGVIDLADTVVPLGLRRSNQVVTMLAAEA
jgi:hypothetical protein